MPITINLLKSNRNTRRQWAFVIAMDCCGAAKRPLSDAYWLKMNNILAMKGMTTHSKGNFQPTSIVSKFEWQRNHNHYAPGWQTDCTLMRLMLMAIPHAIKAFLPVFYQSHLHIWVTHSDYHQIAHFLSPRKIDCISVAQTTCSFHTVQSTLIFLLVPHRADKSHS